MQDQPTPGPWHIEEPQDDDVYRDISIKSGRRTVCRLWQEGRYGSGTNAEQWANARLIAAAPVMLEALQDIARYADLDQRPALAGIAQSAILHAVGDGE
jgi:hypothetical protein